MPSLQQLLDARGRAMSANDDDAVADYDARIRAASGGGPTRTPAPTLDQLNAARQRATAAGDEESAAHYAERIAAAAPPKYDATEGMSTTEKTLAGIGGALEDKWLGARQFANWASGGRIGDKQALADEARRKVEADKDLSDTTAGSVGQFIGAVAPELLVGGGGGLLAKGAMRVPTLARMLPEALTQARSLVPGVAREIGANAGRAADFIGEIMPTATRVAETASAPVRAVGRVLTSSPARAAAFGAADMQLNPDEDYSVGKNALIGATTGFAGDLVGRGLGRVITPLKTNLLDPAAAAVRRQVELLRASDAPSLLARNLSNNPGIEAISSGLESLPFVGAGLRQARKAQGEWLTREATKRVGPEFSALGSEAGDVMAAPTATAKAIRAEAEPVVLSDVPGSLRQTIEDAMAASSAGGTPYSPATRRLTRIEQATLDPRDGLLGAYPTGPVAQAAERGVVATPKVTTDAVTAGAPFTTLERGAPYTPVATGPRLSADDFMTARAELSAAANNATGLEATKLKAAQDALENAYRSSRPEEQAAAFDLWKKQYGSAKGIERVRQAGGSNMTLDPQRLSKEFTKRPSAFEDLNQLSHAAAARMPGAGGAPRSLLLSSMVGLPTAGGIIGGVTGDDPLTGTLKGVGAGIALPYLLSRPFTTTKGGAWLTNKMLDDPTRALSRDAVRRMTEALLLGGVQDATR